MADSHFPPELLVALRSLEEVLPLQDDLEATTTKISQVAVRIVSGCDSASVTLLEKADVRTPGASDEVAIELDHVQYREHSGPCLDAVEQARTLVVGDLQSERRWPEFCKRAMDHGFLSTLSVPIRINGVTGGLNMYGRSKNAFEQASRELTDLIASQASIAIENAKVHSASKRLVGELNDAIKSREIIGEAKGILMAREGVSEDEAFRMLVTVSQSTNTKLRDIAQRIVDKG